MRLGRHQTALCGHETSSLCVKIVHRRSNLGSKGAALACNQKGLSSRCRGFWNAFHHTMSTQGRLFTPPPLFTPPRFVRIYRRDDGPASSPHHRPRFAVNLPTASAAVLLGRSARVAASRRCALATDRCTATPVLGSTVRLQTHDHRAPFG